MIETQPFDLSLLDRDTTRKLKRKKYFTYLALPIATILMVAIYIMLPWITSGKTIDDYSAKRFDTDSTLQKISRLTPIEKSSYYYNQGTMKSADKAYETAISDFEKALGYLGDTSNPLFCRITINLVLSYERWADQLVQQQKQPTAIERYVKALSYIKDHQECFKDRQDQARIEAKLKAVKDAEVSKSDQNKDEQDKKEPSSDDKEQIEKREQEAQKQRSDDRRSSESTNSDDIPDYKQW